MAPDAPPPHTLGLFHPPLPPRNKSDFHSLQRPSPRPVDRLLNSRQRPVHLARFSPWRCSRPAPPGHPNSKPCPLGAVAQCQCPPHLYRTNVPSPPAPRNNYNLVPHPLLQRQLLPYYHASADSVATKPLRLQPSTLRRSLRVGPLPYRPPSRSSSPRASPRAGSPISSPK